jgi:hypothetical protein
MPWDGSYVTEGALLLAGEMRASCDRTLGTHSARFAEQGIPVKCIAVVIVLGLLWTGGNPTATAAQAAQTPSDVNSLLAPIALYPDQLLAHILLSATDPPAVQKLAGWLKANPSLKGTALQDAAVVAGFEPSLVAIALFPTVVNTMAEKLEWTTLVGHLFEVDRNLVFERIQQLRAQAQAAGTLKTTQQQEVETRTTSSGDQVIVIEPTNPQVVYVPQYNATTVYTAPATTSTTVVVKDDNTAETAAAAAIGFTAGIAIGAAINNSYYYGPYGWHGGAYMYNDAWDDYYDAREDAREDWQDHREDLVEERGDRAQNASEQRTERAENRSENRSGTQAQTQAQRQERRTEAQTAAQSSGRATGTSYESRGVSGDRAATASTERSGTRSDAFSGYSSGKSERAASSRGRQSRSSSGSRGGGRRR